MKFSQLMTLHLLLVILLPLTVIIAIKSLCLKVEESEIAIMWLEGAYNKSWMVAKTSDPKKQVNQIGRTRFQNHQSFCSI